MDKFLGIGKPQNTISETVPLSESSNKDDEAKSGEPLAAAIAENLLSRVLFESAELTSSVPELSKDEALATIDSKKEARSSTTLFFAVLS